MTKPCPVCGAERTTVRFPSTVTPDDTTSSAFYVPTYAYARKHREISRCGVCGFQFVTDVVPRADLVHAYEHMEDPVYLLEATAYRAAARHVLGRIEPFLAPGARLLEIGCGAGFFLEAACARGWDARGIELSRWMVERARERVQSERIQQGSYDSDLFRDERFDVAVALDVIEHVEDPGHFVRDVASRLRPGGAAYFVTPDAGSLPARLLGKRWWYLQVPHLSYFDRRTMRRLLERSGFRDIRTGGYPRFLTRDLVRNRLSHLTAGPRRLASLACAPLLAIPYTVRLHLGDQLEVLSVRSCPPRAATSQFHSHTAPPYTSRIGSTGARSTRTR